MLSYLKIKDFAIIEEIELEFDKGMTVLSGETGAGKSIIIDAIGLVLGDRSSKSMIRNGKKKSVIDSIFINVPQNAIHFLESEDIECNENELVIKREISENKSICKINGEVVPVTTLSKLGALLGDIHVQHDTQRLIKPSKYKTLLDTFENKKSKKLLKEYQTFLHDYTENLKTYQEVVNDEKDIKQRIEFLIYQIKEIEALNIKPNEDVELLERKQKLNNYKKIHSSVATALEILNGKSVVDEIYNCSGNIQKAANFDKHLSEISEMIDGAYYQLNEAKSELEDYLESMVYEPTEMEKIESRLFEITNLKRKLAVGDCNELLEYFTTIQKEVAEFTNFDELVLKRKQETINSFNKVCTSAKALCNHRKAVAKAITVKLKKELVDLKLVNVEFKIKIDEPKLDEKLALANHGHFNKDGYEKVDFLISTNPGEPLKPLNKVASGGELSRIMLSLKTILFNEQSLSLVVFDEIDTGVSGDVSIKIAEKMKAIANTSQVFCISHIPQVVGMSDHHLHVEKNVKNNQTNTSAKFLSDDDKITKIAEMLSGEKITQSSIEHAKILLANKNNNR